MRDFFLKKKKPKRFLRRIIMEKDSLRNTSATDNARKGIRDREDKQCSDEFCYKRD